MKKTFRLEGLDCANCAAKMERAIEKLDGVDNVTINFMTTKMIIEGQDDKMPTIISEVDKIIQMENSNREDFAKAAYQFYITQKKKLNLKSWPW